MERTRRGRTTWCLLCTQFSEEEEWEEEEEEEEEEGQEHEGVQGPGSGQSQQHRRAGHNQGQPAGTLSVEALARKRQELLKVGERADGWV